jgi:hypothetical protein
MSMWMLFMRSANIKLALRKILFFCYETLPNIVAIVIGV